MAVEAWKRVIGSFLKNKDLNDGIDHSLKSDRWIRQQCWRDNPMISPFVNAQEKTGEGKPSYGLSSAGYDIRVGDTVMIPKSCMWNYQYKKKNDPTIYTVVPGHLRSSPVLAPGGMVIVPDSFIHGDKNSKLEFHSYTDLEWIDIPPHTFALGVSYETFNIPRNVTGICMGKSTIARAGLLVTVTPLEPEWNGFLTLEFFNTLPISYRLEPGNGITQLMFHEIEDGCEVSYADRRGKYQGQPASPITAR